MKLVGSSAVQLVMSALTVLSLHSSWQGLTVTVATQDSPALLVTVTWVTPGV
jgi:hypothetical protein